MFELIFIAEILLHRGKTEWSTFLQLGDTPLHLAATSGSQPIVELLLGNGVNAEVMDKVMC